MREIDRLIVLGQTRPHTVFEIMGRKGALPPIQIALRDRYSEALSAYRAQRWEDARKAIGAALEAVADDGPSLTLLKRIDEFQRNPPAADWDGSWRIDYK